MPVYVANSNIHKMNTHNRTQVTMLHSFFLPECVCFISFVLSSSRLLKISTWKSLSVDFINNFLLFPFGLYLFTEILWFLLAVQQRSNSLLMLHLTSLTLKFANDRSEPIYYELQMWVCMLVLYLSKTALRYCLVNI